MLLGNDVVAFIDIGPVAPSSVTDTVCLKKPDRYDYYDITSPIHNV